MLFQKLYINPDLQLVAVDATEASALLALILKEKAFLAPWIKWIQRIEVLEDAQKTVNEMALFNRGGQKFYSFIYHQQQLAGSIALVRIEHLNRKGELGFWKSKERLSTINMQLCCEAFIKACFSDRRLHRLEINTLYQNIPARMLAQKLQFRLEGIQKDAIYQENQFMDLALFARINTNTCN